jgi:H+/Cl- antiporter ClcA
VYTAELFPNHIRAKGFSFSIGILVLTTLVSLHPLLHESLILSNKRLRLPRQTYVEVAPTSLDAIGWRFYLVFIVISLVGAIWVWWMFPETKGIPLEEIAAIFGDDDEVVVIGSAINVTEKDGTVIVERKTEHEASTVQIEG